VQKQQFEGYWMLAGSDNSVPGSLTFSPDDGVRLALNGAFNEDAALGSDTKYHTIHGVTPNNKQVTLARCLRGKSTFAAAYPVCEYTSSWMVIGCHFPSYEEMRFKDLSVSYFNLPEIFGVTGITEELTFGPSEMDITLGYKQPDRLTCQLDDFTISTAHSWSVEGDRFEHREVRQRAWLTAEANDARHIDDFLKGPFRSLQTMLELTADSALPIEAMTGKPDLADSHDEVELFFRPPRHVPAPKRRHPMELLFTIYGLGPRFGECLQRWHAGRERYGPTFDLFFALGRLALFLEHQFLSLIQAVESYHRRAFPNHALPPKEHAALVERVMRALRNAENLSDDHRRWVESKIRYNEPPLVDRLLQIYDMLPTKVQRSLGSADKFARTIANTRHYMTHWDEAKRPGALTGSDLFPAVQRLRLVIKAIFLHELGLATDDVVARLPEPRLLERFQ
jgi:hypothetical protein